MGVEPRYRALQGPLPVVLIEAADAIAGGVALLSSPRRHHVGRLDGTRVVDRHGSAIELDAVFEARVFTPTAELRWLRRDDGGTGTVVTDGDGGPGWLDPVEQRYLVWGESAGDHSDGWTTLTTSRGTPLQVPVATGGRARLIAREYVSVDRFGNARVADQRLVGFEEEAP